MSAFIDALNESAITYVRDLGAYGWNMPGDGWEVCSPFGEIRAFQTREDAESWRLSEVREYARIVVAPLMYS